MRNTSFSTKKDVFYLTDNENFMHEIAVKFLIGRAAMPAVRKLHRTCHFTRVAWSWFALKSLLIRTRRQSFARGLAAVGGKNFVRVSIRASNKHGRRWRLAGLLVRADWHLRRDRDPGPDRKYFWPRPEAARITADLAWCGCSVAGRAAPGCPDGCRAILLRTIRRCGVPGQDHSICVYRLRVGRRCVFPGRGTGVFFQHTDFVSQINNHDHHAEDAK